MTEASPVRLSSRPLPMVEGILFHSVSEPDAGVYMGQLVCKLSSEVKLALFERAWQSVMQRHSSLRASFRWEGLTHPVLEIHEHVQLLISVHDWRDVAAAEQQERLEAHLSADAKQGFDFTVAPIMRLALFRLPSDEHIFVWTYHHALLDGRSRTIVLKEVSRFYEAYGAEENVALAEPPEYVQYIDWFYQRNQSAAKKYWKGLLETFVSPAPVVLPLTTAKPSGGRRHANRNIGVSPALQEELLALARRCKITVNIIVQAAWALLLSRYSGQDDIVFGETRSCRRPEFENVGSLVGVLINTLPIRMNVNRARPFIDLLQDLREQHIALRKHELTPLLAIRECSGLANREQLFESIVVFEEYELNAVLQRDACGLWSEGIQLSVPTHYPLAVIGYAKPSLSISIAYERLNISDTVAVWVAEQFRALLERIAQNPGVGVGNILLLTGAEREQILTEWNDTSRDYSRHMTLPQLFEEQVLRAPDMVALVFEEMMLTYAELNERANQLAHYLVKQNVGPEDIVALAMPRSLDMVTGLLGILKAGAAYLPLDPEYPKSRLAYMIENAAPAYGIPLRNWPQNCHKACGSCFWMIRKP